MDFFKLMFILLRSAEAIAWENFVPAVQYKRVIPPFRDETFYKQSQDIIYEEFITLPRSWKKKQNFIPANRDHVITT